MHYQALWAKPRLRALRVARCAALLVALGAPACALYEETVPLGPRAVFVEVEPATLELGVGEAQQLSAVVYAEDDVVLSGRNLVWVSLDEEVATVSATGQITGLSPGVARIRAESGGIVGTAEVHVFYPVVRVEAQLEDTMLFPGERVKAQAHAYNIDGDRLGDRQIHWTVQDTSIAQVDASGVVTALAVGSTELTALAEGVRQSVPIEVVQWEQVSAGFHYSCGLLSNGRAYCWGQNSNHGVLGNGSVDSGENWPEYHHDADAPLPTEVSGDIIFESVTAGVFHTCGLAPGGQAYCWGYGLNGQLGNGAIAPSATPVAVGGEHRFIDIQPGIFHTCGLTTSKHIYCWGVNDENQLGLGSQATTFYFSPQQLSEDSFVALAVGRNHSCAISEQGPTYCWGNNDFGQLGVGAPFTRSTPVEVATDERFVKLAAGSNYTCGLTEHGEAYCWGEGRDAALGTGTTYDRMSPRRARAPHIFVDLYANWTSTCGVDAAGAVYCWGSNEQGHLGNGVPNPMERSPVLVSGGHQWRDFSLGLAHSCGLVVGQAGLFCWGDNDRGQLGGGAFQDYITAPTAAVNP